MRSTVVGIRLEEGAQKPFYSALLEQPFFWTALVNQLGAGTCAVASYRDAGPTSPPSQAPGNFFCAAGPPPAAAPSAPPPAAPMPPPPLPPCPAVVILANYQAPQQFSKSQCDSWSQTLSLPTTKLPNSSQVAMRFLELNAFTAANLYPQEAVNFMERFNNSGAAAVAVNSAQSLNCGVSYTGDTSLCPVGLSSVFFWNNSNLPMVFCPPPPPDGCDLQEAVLSGTLTVADLSNGSPIPDGCDLQEAVLSGILTVADLSNGGPNCNFPSDSAAYVNIFFLRNSDSNGFAAILNSIMNEYVNQQAQTASLQVEPTGAGGELSQQAQTASLRVQPTGAGDELSQQAQAASLRVEPTCADSESASSANRRRRRVEPTGAGGKSAS
eukprot:gene3358-13389_t